jgi:hypothetical protein
MAAMLDLDVRTYCPCSRPSEEWSVAGLVRPQEARVFMSTITGPLPHPKAPRRSLPLCVRRFDLLKWRIDRRKSLTSEV